MEAPDTLTPNPGPRRLPGLDGLRAIAVSLVIFHHLCSQGTFAQWPTLAAVLKRGSFGVQVFFVLSGFLITWLLLGEETRRGRIDLGRFYIRRALRILPPALLYVAVMLMLTAAGILAIGRRDFLYSLFFIRNLYGVGGDPQLAHYWSLAVEEQFYMTWPFVFFLMRGRLRLAFALALVTALSVWRAFPLVHFGVTAGGGQALLIGCALAQIRHLAPTWLTARSARTRSLVVGTATVVVSLVVFTGWPGLDASGLAQTAALLAVAAIVNAVAEGPVTLVSRLISAPPVEWLGRLSYSLYLWQQLFCWGPWPGAHATSGWPLLIGASVLAAAGSYYGVEQPALALRERLEQRLYPHRTARPNDAVTASTR